MGNKILLLRYSDFNGVNTIDAHKKVIEQCGSCWWAKIGKQPQVSYLSDYLNQETKIILLYTAGSLHKCILDDVRRSRPNDKYPDYYNKDIFGKDNEPTVFFKLLSIERMELECLEDYVVSSSGKKVLEDLKKTISSYMFIQHKDLPLPPKPKPREKKIKQVPVFDKFSCVYKKDGICSNSRCVNYKYQCERPQYCTRQKMVKK